LVKISQPMKEVGGQTLHPKCLKFSGRSPSPKRFG
jgi:hypothetical protein